MIIQPFMPAYGSNQAITAAAATPGNATLNKDNRNVRIVNTGANKLYVQTFSNADQAGTLADATDFCVPGGMAATITKDAKHDRLAYLSAAGTTFEVMSGDGF